MSENQEQVDQQQQAVEQETAQQQPNEEGQKEQPEEQEKKDENQRKTSKDDSHHKHRKHNRSHSDKKKRKKEKDRHRKKHKKSKSRQRSKDKEDKHSKHKSKHRRHHKHRSPSSSSSTSYETLMERKKKRQSKFDQPPSNSMDNPLNQLVPGSSSSINMHFALTALKQQKGMGGGGFNQTADSNPAMGGAKAGGIGEPNVVQPQLQFQFKHARRVYVGNVPDHVTNEHLIEFIYRTLEMAGGLLEPGNPIISSELELSKKYMFLEMRSIEETDGAMQLDGIIYQGKSLRFRRPRDYENFGKVKGSREVPKLNLDAIGMSAIATQVSEGPNKLFVAGIPNEFDEGMAIEHLNLRLFGNIRAFHLVKDKVTNQSRGFAFLSYDSEVATEKCIQQLNGLQLKGRVLKCKKATTNSQAEQNKKNLQNITSLTDNLTTGGQQIPNANYIQLNYQQNSQQQQFDQQQMAQNYQFNPQFSQLTGIYPPNMQNQM